MFLCPCCHLNKGDLEPISYTEPAEQTGEIPLPAFMCTHSIYCTNQNVFMQLEADFNSEAKRVLGCSTSGQMKCCSSMDINSVLSHSQTFPSSLFPHPTLVHFPPRLSLCQCHTYFDTCGLAADDGGVCFFFLCLKVESGW